MEFRNVLRRRGIDPSVIRQPARLFLDSHKATMTLIEAFKEQRLIVKQAYIVERRLFADDAWSRWRLGKGLVEVAFDEKKTPNVRDRRQQFLEGPADNRLRSAL